MASKRIYSNKTRSYHSSKEAKEVAEGYRCAECKVCFVKGIGHEVLCIDCYSIALLKGHGKPPKYPRSTIPEIEPSRYECDVFPSERELKEKRNKVGIPWPVNVKLYDVL